MEKGLLSRFHQEGYVCYDASFDRFKIRTFKCSAHTGVTLALGRFKRLAVQSSL